MQCPIARIPSRSINGFWPSLLPLCTSTAFYVCHTNQHNTESSHLTAQHLHGILKSLRNIAGMPYRDEHGRRFSVPALGLVWHDSTSPQTPPSNSSSSNTKCEKPLTDTIAGDWPSKKSSSADLAPPSSDNQCPTWPILYRCTVTTPSTLDGLLYSQDHEPGSFSERIAVHAYEGRKGHVVRRDMSTTQDWVMVVFTGTSSQSKVMAWMRLQDLWVSRTEKHISEKKKTEDEDEESKPVDQRYPGARWPSGNV